MSRFLRPGSRPPIPFDLGLALAGLLALFVILPLLQPGLPATADTPIHLYRALEFARSWGPGVIYPRWAPDLAFGYGYPLWNFAPPLPYLIPLALHALGLSLEAGLKGLVMLTALGYALGAYMLVRDSLGTGAGLVAATAYTLAPFALREALLYGGNYPQYLAVGLFPWALWALGRVQARGGPLDIVLAAAVYAAIILSHLFHALALTVAAAAYGCALWLGDGHNSRRLAAAALALGLGLLGTAFFWLPALIERSFTRAVEDVYVSVSPFYLRFLSWSELLAWPQALDSRAANPWVPFSLGPAALVLAGLGLLALRTNRRPQTADHRPPSAVSRVQGLFFVGLVLVCIFMMLPVSNWLWANVPFLAVAEFPWRLMGLASLGLAFLSGASLGWPVASQRPALALGGIVAVLLTSAVYLYPFRPFVHYGQTVADMAGYELATRTVGTTTLGEYLPRWATSAPSSSPLVPALMAGEQIDKLDRASLPAQATAQLLEHNAVSDSYQLASPQAFEARFLTYYFPGWTAHLDGQPVGIIIEPKSGLMRVPIPIGSHMLRLHFGDTPLRSAANAVSGLTLAGLLLAGLRRLVHRAGGRPPTADRRPTQAVNGLWSAKRPEVAVVNPQPGSRWSPGSVLFVGGMLLGLLLLKELVVDPHTLWFRQASPPGQVNGVGHPMRVNLDGQIWLLGYDLDREAAVQGGELRVILYWQAQGPLAINYRSFVHLDAPTDQRTWAGSDNFHPGDATAQIELPTATWDTLHYVRDEHWLRIPPQVPPTSFDLRAGLYDPETGQRLPITGEAGSSGSSDTIRLQRIQVTLGRGLRLADVPNLVSYQLGEHIRLIGYGWDRDGATLTLYWQSNRQPPAGGGEVEADYVVFVHVLDQQGRLIWGADGPPLGGLYPTSAWRSGEIVADPRPLGLEELPPGTYTLEVGLYHPASLARLPVSDEHGQPVADDAIPLTRLTWP